MSVRKILLLAAAIIAALICLGFIGVRLFTTAIYESDNCEWANIDNIELHALVDIPPTTDSDCRIDKVENAKYATFMIDLEEVDIDKYIADNKFVKVQSSAQAQKYLSQHYPDAEMESFTYANLYERHGSYKDETSSLLPDAETGKLSVTIKYGK